MQVAPLPRDTAFRLLFPGPQMKGPIPAGKSNANSTLSSLRLSEERRRKDRSVVIGEFDGSIIIHCRHEGGHLPLGARPRRRRTNTKAMPNCLTQSSISAPTASSSAATVNAAGAGAGAEYRL